MNKPNIWYSFMLT